MPIADGGAHRSCLGQPCCEANSSSQGPCSSYKPPGEIQLFSLCFLLMTLLHLLVSAHDVGVSVGDQWPCLGLYLCVFFDFACFAAVSGCPSSFFCLCVFPFSFVFLSLDPHTYLVCLFINPDISVRVSLCLSISVSLCYSAFTSSRRSICVFLSLLLCPSLFDL